MSRKAAKCQWVSLCDALRAFVLCESPYQSAGHIKPLHWYVACRLVVEGGFRPEEVTPRPPFSIRTDGGEYVLDHVPGKGGAGERTVPGGLKTKAVDVVVTKDGIGPVLVDPRLGDYYCARVNGR